MQYKIAYKIGNKLDPAKLSGINFDGEIGSRFDAFVYERVSGKFAIDYILGEAEGFFADKFDDEYAIGMWRSEFWGKLILSAVRVCNMTNDAQLKEDIKASVYKVLGFQEDNGYLSTYRDRFDVFCRNRELAIEQYGQDVYFYNWNIWGQKYTLWALIEAAMLLDDNIVLNAAVKMADCILDVFRTMKIRVKDAGVMDGMPASSILKPMLILYRLTAKNDYYDFCMGIVKEWEREDNERPNLIKNALAHISPANWYDPKDGWISKAYEMTSCFDGIIELYRISGDEHYFEAAKNFWETLLEDEENPLGSAGFCERYQNGAAYQDSATEICDVIHWMRISYELFALTGEARYMASFEKAFLNAFLAGVNYDGKGCAFFVRSAGRHLLGEPQVQTKYQHCCLNNVPRGFVNAAESAVMFDKEDIYVNMFFPITVRKQGLTIRISNGYTTGGKVKLTVRGAKSGQKMFIRIPEWSKDTKIIIGGKAIDAKCSEYYELILAPDQELVTIKFDMTPRVMDFDKEYKELPLSDYHVGRWVDSEFGLVNRSQMTKHKMSVIHCGPVILARSKRIGCTEKEMFSGETVWGKNARCTLIPVRSDRLLAAYRVKLETKDKVYDYTMCDIASAANMELEDPYYFNLFV